MYLKLAPAWKIFSPNSSLESRKVSLIEVDTESVNYLQAHYASMAKNIHEADFLKVDLSRLMGENPFGIIGNFPYNISTQIVFKTIENREQIPFFSGMFQKELAQSFCVPPGSKR